MNAEFDDNEEDSPPYGSREAVDMAIDMLLSWEEC